jgi:predicted lipid-binding transport protein (Tim44 family)
MNSLFDPLNLILLAIALLVFWKLRNVLGTRTGLERPPAEPVVLKPRNGPAPAPAPEQSPALGVEDREPPKPVWHGVAQDGSDVAKALEAIVKISPDFTVESFLEGAKMAYEMVLQAYAAGDKQALKPLLGADVLQSFSAAIDRRKAEGSRFVFQFVGVKHATLPRAVLDGRTAMITVNFRSQMIQALLSRDGETLDGDEKSIREVEDIWTFERDVTSRDPNWKLVATDDDIG